MIAKTDDYPLAGYLSSYLADLYLQKELFDLALEKYNEAAGFHARSGNRRSQALALRDAVYCYLEKGWTAEALSILQKADSIARSTNDPITINAISSDFGVVYCQMKRMNEAETYLLTHMNTNDPWPTYLALADVYIKKKEYGKAREYAEKAMSESTKGDVLRLQYLIEKAEGNPGKAIDYLEQYKAYIDSSCAEQNKINVYEVEQRYDKSQLENENIRLHIAILYRTLAIVIISICAAIGLLLFRRAKNRRIRRQQEGRPMK